MRSGTAPAAAAGPSTAGIVTDASSGERVVPESRRADGSIRKERKVKPGFEPVEDVARFRPSRVLRARAEEQEIAKGAPKKATDTAQRILRQPLPEPAARAVSPATSQGSAASVWASAAPVAKPAAKAPEWRRATAARDERKPQARLRRDEATPEAWDSKETAAPLAEAQGHDKTEGRAVQKKMASNEAAKAKVSLRASDRKAASVDAIADELASLDIKKKKAASES